MMWWEDFAVGSVDDMGTHTFTAEEIVAFGRQFDPQPYTPIPSPRRARRSAA